MIYMSGPPKNPTKKDLRGHEGPDIMSFNLDQGRTVGLVVCNKLVVLTKKRE